MPAPRDGYIQTVDGEVLLRAACEHRTVVRMARGIGGFVVKETTLAWLATDVAADAGLVGKVQGAYGIDRYRTVEQDAAFGIRQIVDMALRALSPGINDTTTAVMCVDHLSAILSRLAPRAVPCPRRYVEGDLRMIAVGPTFAGLVAESFDQIRASASGNVAILLRMLDAIETIASLTDADGRRRILREHADALAELAERTLEAPRDRVRFEARWERVAATLAAGTSTRRR